MSESKSNIFEKPTNEEINTLLFNDDQIPTIINDAHDSAQNKEEVNSTDQKIEDRKLNSSNSELKSYISGQNSSKSIESKNDSKNNQSNLITNQEIAESKNNSSVPAVNQQITSTSTNNTDPTQKTSNDDDTGVNLQLRLPKK